MEFWQDTLPIHLSYYLDDVPSQFFFFLQGPNLIGPLLKKNETMEAPQNRSFYSVVYSSSPLARLYRC
jgi:hypothetical protein